jgi:palmitoyltransferase ZDHHC13/17
MCMRRLIEEGADITALTTEGKSPLKLAEEMKCSLVFDRALKDSGRYNQDLTPRRKPHVPADIAKIIIFCSPFVTNPLLLSPFPRLLFCPPCALSFAFVFILGDLCKVLIWIALVMFSSLPFYLSSWMVPGWLLGANTLVRVFVLKDLRGATQIHKTPYLSGIFAGTAALVALRWSFVILPCTPLHPSPQHSFS